MESNLITGIIAITMSVYFFYRVIFKKEKQKYIAGTSACAGALLVIAIFRLSPFVAKIISWLFFST